MRSNGTFTYSRYLLAEEQLLNQPEVHRHRIFKHGEPSMPMMSMSKLLTLSAATLLVSACAHHPQGMSGTDPVGMNSVSVTGTGEVQAIPDRFGVRAVASREGQDINKLKQAVDKEVAAVLALAQRLGIEEKNLRAASLSVQPQWEWEPERKLVGYRVARDIDVTAQGLDVYAQLLEGMTQIGLSEVHPTGSEISNQEAVEQKALAEAVENARARAQVLANAAGRKLGKVMQIEAQSGSEPPPVPMMEMRAKVAQDSAWTPGETDVRQDVRVRFELQ